MGQVLARTEPLAVIQVLPHRTSHDQIELSAPFGLDQVGKSVVNLINLRQRMGCHTGIPNFLDRLHGHDGVTHAGQPRRIAGLDPLRCR